MSAVETNDTTAQAPRRSNAAVWVLPVAIGGCGVCMQSVTALLAPHHAAALAAQGITFARSPRHANVLLLTGPLTDATYDAAQDLVDGVPQPRALVAVGNCAIDGCVFHGSPDLLASAAEALDVNVEIAGCPPAPSAILAAIAEAANLLVNADASGDDAHDNLTDNDAGEDAQ